MKENTVYQVPELGDTYEVRCILFMDIVGFRALIDNGEEDKIYRILHTATRIAYDPPEALQGLEITSFSDSLVVSAPLYNRRAVDLVCTFAIQLALEFIDESIMTRGAIVIGKLKHSGAIVFGPALNTAYDYEQSLAKYPRIVVSDEVIETERQQTEELFKEMFAPPFTPQVHNSFMFRKDFDGIRHLNIFTPLFSPIVPAVIRRKERKDEDYSKAIAQIMHKTPQLKQDKAPTANDLNTIAKYQWLQNFFVAEEVRNENMWAQLIDEQIKLR